MSDPQRRAERPDARGTAAEILRRVEESGAFASRLLDHRERGFTHVRDAALLHELVLGALRQRAALDHVLSRTSRRPLEAIDPRLRRLLHLGIYEILFLDRVPGYASVDEAVESAKRMAGRGAAAFVNGVLRTVARQGIGLLPPEASEGDRAALALRSSHPRWWIDRMVSRWGWEATVRVVAANQRPAPTVLRFRDREGPRPRVASRLAEEGVTAAPGRFSPHALRVERGRFAGTRVFREGAWVQDEASQLVSFLLGAPAPVPVLDACAAPGGKTLSIADGLPEGGWIVAMDRHPGRVLRLSRSVRRLGFADVHPLAADLLHLSIRGPFPRILLDAPCSGSGTFRRRPELRFRLREEDVPRLAARQGAMLERAAAILGAGGVLVYSVCSVEPEEGEGVVREFLERHPSFRVEDPSPWLPDAARVLCGTDGFVRTIFEPDWMDGFQAVRLVRR